MISQTVLTHFGNKLRVRVNGVLLENDRLLLVKHVGIGEDGYLWMPPGGGAEFGSSATENLKREYLEETGLIVEVENFLFVCELLQPPLHAIELFFSVKKAGGSLIKGIDPELSKSNQIITEVKFMSVAEINQLPATTLHKVLQGLTSYNDLLKRNAYIRI